MLTQRDLEIFAGTGNITPDRIRALIYALRREVESAKALSEQVDNDYLAAALRGKYRGHRETIAMLECLLESKGIRRPRRVRRAERERREAKKES